MEAAPVYVSTTATAEDLQQLKLLSIFHYVLAGITGLFSLFPLIHLFMGLAIVTGHLPMTTTNAAALEQALDAQSLAHWRIGQVVTAQGDERVRIG